MVAPLSRSGRGLVRSGMLGMDGGRTGTVPPPGTGLVGVRHPVVHLFGLHVRNRNVQRVLTLADLLVRQIPRHGLAALACVMPIGHGALPSRRSSHSRVPPRVTTETWGCMHRARGSGLCR